MGLLASCSILLFCLLGAFAYFLFWSFAGDGVTGFVFATTVLCIFILVQGNVGPNSPPAPSGACCSQARHISPGRVNLRVSSCVNIVGIFYSGATTPSCINQCT